MSKTDNPIITDTMSIDEIKKQIAKLEADQKQALKDLRKAQREAANEAKATLARAQSFADEKVGRRLREAGATDAVIDRIVKQLEERRAAEKRAEKPAAAVQQKAPEKPAEKPAAAEPKPAPATPAQKPAEASKPTPRPSAFSSFSH